MRKGINFDTGFISAGATTHEPFDPQVVKREMQIIHDDLHCDAVRVTGGYPGRLEMAAAYAVEAGLEVWFCPFTNNLTTEQLLELLVDCAERAERVRKCGGEVVFLTGSELSLVTVGLLPATLRRQYGLRWDPVRGLLLRAGTEYTKRLLVPVLPSRIRYGSGRAAA